jgi:hypothetical protein
LRRREAVDRVRLEIPTKKNKNKIKGQLFWQFSQLCCMGTLSPDELDLCHLVIQHLRRLTLRSL